MHNLLDELPWITGTRLDGEPFTLSLEDTFRQAEQLSMIVTENPIQTAAILRLMTAAVLVADAASDESIDADTVVARLRRYRDRFELTDSPDAFMQTPIVDREPRTVAALDPMRASGGDHTLWDHRTIDDLVVITPDQAARQLVACQAGATGGVQKGPHREGSTSADRSGPKGSITRNAVVFIIGRNLAQTLAYACLGAPRITGDVPCWEQPTPSNDKQHRDPKGPCDWLTWMPRRIWLSVDGSGNYDGCIIRPGFVHSDEYDPLDLGHEPHVAWRVVKPTELEPVGSNWINRSRAAGLYENAGDHVVRFTYPGPKEGKPSSSSVPANDQKKVERTRKKLGEKHGSLLSEQTLEEFTVGTIRPGRAAAFYADRHPESHAKTVWLCRGTDLAKYTGDSMFYLDTTTWKIPGDANEPVPLFLF